MGAVRQGKSKNSGLKAAHAQQKPTLLHFNEAKLCMCACCVCVQAL